jgi:hypothetical protein
MEICRNFFAPMPEAEARERAVAFFTGCGYKPVFDGGGIFTFERGSILGTVSNFNPKSWAGKVRVRISPGSGVADITVIARLTSDPFERSFARELLTAEIDAFEGALRKRKTGPVDTEGLKKRVAANVYRTVGLVGGVIFAAVPGVLGWLLLYRLLHYTFLLALISGIFIFLILAVLSYMIYANARNKKI